MRALHALVALLRLEAEGGDGACLKAPDADRLVRLLAIAVAAILDPHQRRIDLGDELALAVADAEREVPIVLERGTVPSRARRDR